VKFLLPLHSPVTKSTGSSFMRLPSLRTAKADLHRPAPLFPRLLTGFSPFSSRPSLPRRIIIYSTAALFDDYSHLLHGLQYKNQNLFIFIVLTKIMVFFIHNLCFKP
jgi:hypothetical protein